ncbi:MAG: ParB/RepB/Spo0J family partition protein, partial [Verrucomicrobia bacterium]|nr:ParB/RepB/Spo0J family partition protein [Verrucomicrobiota bacterium]
MAKAPLGRGLGALLGTSKPVPPPLDSPEVRAEEGERVQQLGIGDIRPSRFQPRRVFAEESLAELVDSIRAKGIFQPLIVRRSGSGAGYELIAGERRWRA